ncbi:Arylsulfatase A [Lutibacter agarilyticus]|uniref:Arylsulfatase A n=1 Tax=Lutibacter agarilyticus TaxID=1109740 RepID=A0A238WAT1_9FLAO|nr:sulfatase-like hydrolase/transferase [Lutibacter agarilyticus]SNR43662.1 Arylsulfatase A [Lutibacter agarilyticus]
MNKRKNLTYVLLALTLFTFSCKEKEVLEKNNKKPPNILILFSDQHNKKVTGYEGHPDVQTPNLDKLASESFVFDRAYCTTGICAPARSSFLTGIYPRTLGILSNSEDTNVMKEVVSLPSILKTQGYKTYAFGKRHTKSSIDEGWDVKKSHLCSESEDNYVTWIEAQGYSKEFAIDWAAEFGKPSSCSHEMGEISIADLGTRISELPEGYTMEAYTAMNTIEMIKEHKDSDQPFFCWATFYRPHQPYTPLKKYMDMYDVSDWGTGTNNYSSIKKPISFYEPTEKLPPFLQSQRNGGNKVWNMDKAFEDEQLWRNYIGAYYALVTELDFYVGEIINSLEKAGMKDETVIIYSTDHGDFVGNHGMVEKAAMGHNIYEDILNIPLIIHYPGQSKGGKNYELVSQVDILPTILEMAGVEMPMLKHKVQGKSLHNLMQNNTSLNRDYIVSESWSQATVISENFKLGIMLDPTDFRKQFDYREYGDMFFDRLNDSLELQNQINNESCFDQINQLKSYYKEFEQNYPDIGKQEVVKDFSTKE